jgi:formate dehydrogenase major subunit
VNLLKAYWGDAAIAENDYCFDYLPRLTGDHGTYQTVMDMLEDKVEDKVEDKGYFLLGQNPAVRSAHGKMQRLAMAHLKWRVIKDLNMIESASWMDAPEIETGELAMKDIGTEVFFFPAASQLEKDGTFTQTQRMLQWHHKAVEPPGDCRCDLHFFLHLGRKLRERLAESALDRDRPFAGPDLELPGRREGRAIGGRGAEINGYHLAGEKAGQPLSSFTEMKADGPRPAAAGSTRACTWAE